MKIKGEELVIEQYQCQTCGRFFYIDEADRSDFDIEFGCVYGCDDAGKKVRTLTVKIGEIEVVEE